MFIRNAWYMAAWAGDVTEKPIARTLLNQPVVLYRQTDGTVAALEDRCCHRGAPLVHGRVVSDGLECGYHGLVFNASGQCIRVPGQAHVPPGAEVRSYPVQERDEIVWFWAGDPAKADPSAILDYPFNNDHAKWPHKSTTYNVKCHYQLIIDNLLDLTHLAFVHRTTVGGAPAAEANAKMKVTRTPTGVHFIRWMLGCMPPPTYKAAVGFAGPIDRWQDFEFIAPGTVTQFTGALDQGKGAYEEGKREGGFALRIFHGITPETEHTSHYFWAAANGYRQSEPAATQQLFDQIEAAFREDEAILEAQYARVRQEPDRPLIDFNVDAARIQARRHIEERLRAENEALRLVG